MLLCDDEIIERFANVSRINEVPAHDVYVISSMALIVKYLLLSLVSAIGIFEVSVIHIINT